MRPRAPGASLSFLLLCALSAAQSTWYVDASAAGPGSGTSKDPYASIQHALSRSTTVDGDTVLVQPGTYAELVDFLGKSLVLSSTGGAAVTTIDVTTQVSLEQSAIKVRGVAGLGCTLEGFTIRGGAGTETVEPLFGATLFAGGGVLVIGSNLAIRECILVRNYGANIGGGLYAEAASLVVERCTIEENETAYWGAGAVLNDSDVTMRDSTVRANRALHDGGGIRMTGGKLLLENVVLDENTAGLGGNGGNLALDRGARLTMRSVTVLRGFTLDGNAGGLWADDCAIELVSCSFEDNSAGDGASNREGGALRLEGSSLVIDGAFFTRNTSARGGALCLSRSSAWIRDSRFVENGARSGLNYLRTDGGALTAIHSAVTIEGSVFQLNVATSSAPFSHGSIARGGAVWCDTPGLVIRDCLFEQNHAFYDGPADPSLSKHEAGALGGALFGPARVSGSRFRANRATANEGALIGRSEGGAVFGASRLTHCDFSANEVNGVGPVPDVGPAAEASTLGCCTFAGNLPASLPPLGPHCVTHPCEGIDAAPGAPSAERSRLGELPSGVSAPR